MTVRLSIAEMQIDGDLDLTDGKEIYKEIVEVPVGGPSNYEELDNLPSLNGVPLIGNINETDPTVPAWAKEATKPTYSADEIGALKEEDAISIEELNKLFENL